MQTSPDHEIRHAAGEIFAVMDDEERTPGAFDTTIGEQSNRERSSLSSVISRVQALKLEIRLLDEALGEIGDDLKAIIKASNDGK